MQMVNTRFPERAGYGFEMVDAANIRPVTGFRHQWKIYGESNRSTCGKIFR
jgi:hypothetical protein